jgi:alkanesulfonate monooxygenase SsuD/methylene tetrahydromethanopterin reductase-like flavin-dependent oxidoreductase (luciferase family)
MPATVPRSPNYGVFVPNFGPFGDVDALVDLARETEAAGWDGFFVWDHILFDLQTPQEVADPWIALAAIAAATSRIRLGALVTPLARRRPWKVARETTTLDRLSKGRLIFGAGLGAPVEPEFAAFGEETDDRVRAAVLDEALAILAGLWTGEDFAFTGTHHHLETMRFLPKPIQRPRPPIWIAGWWPNKPPFRRAARWDGIFAEKVGGATPTPDELVELLSYITAHRSAVGPFDVVLSGITAPDQGAAGRAVAPYLAAGLTWWLERTDQEHGFSIEAAHARVAAGPPRVA